MKPATIGTNILLKSMEGCKDVNYLGVLMNDETVSPQVRKRAHWKIAQIWREKDRRSVIAAKAQATKQKNKDLAQKKLAETDLT